MKLVRFEYGGIVKNGVLADDYVQTVEGDPLSGRGMHQGVRDILSAM